MSLLVKPYTFTVGATIIAAEHNANFDTLYNDYNGNIDNNNIAPGAGIVDTKLAQITTAGKVHVSALTPAGSYIEPGMMMVWSGTIATIPSGYLICDGSAINRTTYSDLFSAIGTLHGVGDGSTTFNIPNLTDRFIIHADADSGGTNNPADTGGANSVTLTASESGLPNHTHSIPAQEGYAAGTGYLGGRASTSAPAWNETSGGVTPASASSAHENRPAFYAMAYVIKT